MTEKLIGSLIYGEHDAPKSARPWRQRLKMPAAVALALLVIGGLAYTFANYREERHVRQFLQTVSGGEYEAAYAFWENANTGGYTIEDFLQDWGENGEYTKAARPEVIDSNTSGRAVIVYVSLDTHNRPLALRVDKETFKLSYSPVNKYPR